MHDCMVINNSLQLVINQLRTVWLLYFGAHVQVSYNVCMWSVCVFQLYVFVAPVQSRNR